MPEGFPGHNLVAEPLHKVRSVHEHTERQDDQELTAIISCISLFEYVLMTFTATSRPQCSHSTHPQNHSCATRRWFGHNKQGPSRPSEGVRGGHTSCMTI